MNPGQYFEECKNTHGNHIRTQNLGGFTSNSNLQNNRSLIKIEPLKRRIHLPIIEYTEADIKIEKNEENYYSPSVKTEIDIEYHELPSFKEEPDDTELPSDTTRSEIKQENEGDHVINPPVVNNCPSLIRLEQNNNQTLISDNKSESNWCNFVPNNRIITPVKAICTPQENIFRTSLTLIPGPPKVFTKLVSPANYLDSDGKVIFANQTTPVSSSKPKRTFNWLSQLFHGESSSDEEENTVPAKTHEVRSQIWLRSESEKKRKICMCCSVPQTSPTKLRKKAKAYHLVETSSSGVSSGRSSGSVW